MQRLSSLAGFKDAVLPPADPLRSAITAAIRRDERVAVQGLLQQISTDPATTLASQTLAKTLIQSVRAQRSKASGVDALMHEFSLSSDEGIALMCLAEALLRIPDHQTADRLIADKISRGDWRRHLGESPSLFVNATTWGLLVTGKIVTTSSEHGLAGALSRLISKGGEPLIRKGLDLAMRMLGNQFVTGQTIDDALQHSRANAARGYTYSYDMLGEAALTSADALRYFAAYEAALHAIGQHAAGLGIRRGPGISVKLSALHPRYVRAQRGRVMRELLPRLKQLVLLAKQYQVGLNIDAEEADRLELSLDLIEALAFDPELAGFDGIGIVVQAYQKRAPLVLDYLIDLAQRSGHRFMLRLVKGAYWDSEIKRAQVDGMSSYPVYTRKVYTDLCYLVCAQKMLAAGSFIYPQFATHNAQTVATILTWANQANITDFEFQCLHGMGESLYDQIIGSQTGMHACRIYAPVGSHKTLLAYLVRRLLENGANSSFVNQIVDPTVSIDSLVADPIAAAQRYEGQPHPLIPLPVDLFAPERKNSAGIDLQDEDVLRQIAQRFTDLATTCWQAAPLMSAQSSVMPAQTIKNPADQQDIVGSVSQASWADVDAAIAQAEAFAMDWQTTEPAERGARLLRAADLFESHRLELMALAIREAGKTLPNALAEVREATDFLRYYAQQMMHAPDGLALGPVVCISPWNFPLAIFIGQISAALAAGNVVLAKPAEQTPLIAYRAVQLLHQAGIPRQALQFLPGSGDSVGARLIADHRIRGVLFTGSTQVAHILHRTLARRAVEEGSEIVLVAETGGQNVMIVDSSALIEQVVQDVLYSAFDSAGQRCSALRVLCLQEDIAEQVLYMLRGAMQELQMGDPAQCDSDVGPVIDAQAQQHLLAEIARRCSSAQADFRLPVPATLRSAYFVAPCLLEIQSMREVKDELFGPALHVLRYQRAQLPQLLADIDASGFGLTMGIHSRIDETIDAIIAHARVGNIYVNRNMVGAVVGVQPFGGEGKSGTGPKAGGPWYLRRLQRAPLMMVDDVLREESEHGRQPAAVMSKPLDQLIDWASAHANEDVAALGRHYRATSPLGKSLSMPGPTGEVNTLTTAARGLVLCAADSAAGLLNQCAAVFATGNSVLVFASSTNMLPAGLPEEVRQAMTVIESLAEILRSADMDLRFGLLDPAQMQAYRLPLAGREGVLVSLLETQAGQVIPLWRLVTERAFSINTAAAGGNASLMRLNG